MTAILQPDFTGIWAELDEQTRSTVFPLLTGDARRAVLDASKQIFDAEARAEHLKIKAEEALFWDDVRVEKTRLQQERSGAADTWKPVDLADLFDSEQEEATVGRFLSSETSNGGGVFYAGKVNEIHGKSESGKTMVLLAVAAQEIRAGNHVVMIDFEDGGQSIVNRLRWVFSLTREEIVKQFHYFRPEVAFGERGLESISEIADVTFVIIDAVTESMSMAGLDGRNENEVASWYNDFPKKLAHLGSAVCVVDHTPQDNDQRQIGSQHKKSAVDGVSYTAEPISPFVKGGRGHLRLKIAKDKPGGVRPHALPQGDGKQFWRGDFKIDGRGDTTHFELYGVEPAAFDLPASGGPAAPVDVQLPPPSLAPILTALSDDGEWMGTVDIGRATGATKDDKDRLRTYANRLAQIGMAEKKMSGSAIKYKITQKGIHSANAWINEARKSAQTKIE